MNRRKGLIIILDGLGDRPQVALGDKTPLEAAATPALNELAGAGMCGMMDPIRPGLAVDTHTGVGILFGIAPDDALELRRGPIEAAGIGDKFKDGDILLRANFATVEFNAKAKPKYKILDRRAGRIDAEAAELCIALRDMKIADAISASLHPATQHRAVLQLSGARLSAEVSDTDPGGHNLAAGILESTALDDSKESRVCAAAINNFSKQVHKLLDKHPINAMRRQKALPPANAVLLRSAGMKKTLRGLPQKLNIKVGVVAGEKTILGLAKLLNYEIYTDARFTSLLDTDLHAKLNTAAHALNKNDLVFVHIKGTDIAAHDLDPQGKADFIARFDSELKKVFDSARNEIVIGITADHSTDSNTGEHSGDPVPILIHSSGGRRDRINNYGESDCMHGGLGRISARDFLASVLDAMDAR